MKNELTQAKYTKGDIIFQEGDTPDAVYYIEKGGVEIYREQYGERITIARKGEGEVFGEMALVDNKPRSASVMAHSDTTCLILTEKQFQQHMATLDPFILAIVRSMSQTIRELNETQSIILNMLNLKVTP